MLLSTGSKKLKPIYSASVEINERFKIKQEYLNITEVIINLLMNHHFKNLVIALFN